MFKKSLILCLAATMALSASAMEKDSSLVRETQNINVRGVEEVWALAWDKKPSPVCSPTEIEMAITCPCSGLAYGEYGNLFLVRQQNGHETERMDLRPLFSREDYPDSDKLKGTAYLQRWPLKDTDFDRDTQGDAKLVSEIKHRPVTKIMKFADYDRDGQASEFLIQVGTLPCGKLQFAAVGVSANNPHLHALVSAEQPNEPLIMPIQAWEALLKGPTSHTVTTWLCGDHGSDSQSELTVSAANGIIHVKAHDTPCANKSSPK